MTTSVHINRRIPDEAWERFKGCNKFHGLFLPMIVHDFEFYNDFHGMFSFGQDPNHEVIFTHSEQKDPLTVGIIVWRNTEYSMDDWNGPSDAEHIILNSKSHGYYLCSTMHNDRIATVLEELQDTVTHIEVEETENVIEEWTFAGYRKLEAVNLRNVEVVGCGAFYECENLYKLSGGKNLRILGASCFAGCALNYVILGMNIEFIGQDAFWHLQGSNGSIKYVAFDRSRANWIRFEDERQEEIVYGGDWERPDISGYLGHDGETEEFKKLLLRRELQYRPLRLDAILKLGLHYLYEDKCIIEWNDAIAEVFPSDAVYSGEEIVSMAILKHL